MDRMLVAGGKTLNGTVVASGAKNAALPILFSTLLAEGEHVLHNVPRLLDIDSTLKLLNLMGCEAHWIESNSIKIKVKALTSFEAHYDVVRKMRAKCIMPP